MQEYQDLLTEMKQEFPDFELVYKVDSKLMKAINLFLMLLSFGTNKAFMTEFVTTVKNKVYLNSGWDKYTDKTKCILLRHERVHMRQAKRLGFYWFSFLYLLVFLPIGFAYYRAKFEQEAYEESLRAIYEYHGPRVLQSKSNKEFTTNLFTGPAYGWMFPFKSKVDQWYDQAVNKIMQENNNIDNNQL